MSGLRFRVLGSSLLCSGVFFFSKGLHFRILGSPILGPCFRGLHFLHYHKKVKKIVMEGLIIHTTKFSALMISEMYCNTKEMCHLELEI